MQPKAPGEPEVNAEEEAPSGGGSSGTADPVEEASPSAEEAEVAAAGEQEPLVEEALEAQVAEWKNLAMRATADLDNFRKRISREKEEALRYANRGLLEELLPILDNFEMGMQAAGQEEGSMVFQGMQMVKKQLDDFLARNGVEEVEAEGRIFDPNVHEAVSQEESGEAPEGTVLRVVRRGFTLRDRLLRPANVVVAKPSESQQ
jgi:molecular chaperone GrpE